MDALLRRESDDPVEMKSKTERALPMRRYARVLMLLPREAKFSKLIDEPMRTREKMLRLLPN
jgi:hypothetical protein